MWIYVSTDKYNINLATLVRINSICSCFYQCFFLTFLLLYYKHTNRSLKHSELKWKNCNFKTAPGKIFNLLLLSLKSCIHKQHYCKPPLACGSSDERAPHRSGYPRARWGTYLVKNKFCKIFHRVERPHVWNKRNNIELCAKIIIGYPGSWGMGHECNTSCGTLQRRQTK